MKARSPSVPALVQPLPNGATLLLAPMPHVASVSVGFWVAVGGRHEEAALSGVSHFIEHMLFKGTRRRSARQISEAVEGVGGYLNAFTSEEHTCYYARAPLGQFPLLVDVLGDMVLNPVFAHEEIDKERAVIKEEIAMYLDQPSQHVQELLNAALWPGHPLGRPLTGSPEGLDLLQRDELQGYFRQHYVGGNLVIAVAGNLTLRQAIRAVEPVTRRLRPGTKAAFCPATSRQRGPVIQLATKETEQTQLALGIRTCSRHDPRRFALRLLNAILGENMSSRLFILLREERALAYSVGSSISFFADAGDLVVSLGLETANVAEALRLILAELDRLRSKPPGKAEFQRALDYSLGQVDLGLETSEHRMNWLGEQMLGHGRIQSPGQLKRRFKAVKPAEIRAVAQAFFRPERLNLALVSPLKRVSRFKRILAAW